MQADLAQLISAARATWADPRAAARRIIALDLPMNTAVLALISVAVITAILSYLVMPPAGETGGDHTGGQVNFLILLSPIQLAIVQIAGLLISAMLIRVVGGWFGGAGQLRHAVAMVAWIEALLLMLQIVQLFALMIIPPLAVLLGLFGIGMMFWLAVHFIAELHGFASRAKIFFGVLATGLGVSVLLAVVIGLAVGPIGG